MCVTLGVHACVRARVGAGVCKYVGDFLSNHFAITARVQKGQEKFFNQISNQLPVKYIQKEVHQIFISITNNQSGAHSLFFNRGHP